jgi:hypothetical protein
MKVILKSKHPTVKGSALVFYPTMKDLQLFDDDGEPMPTGDIISLRIDSSIHVDQGMPTITITRAVTELEIDLQAKE